MECEQPSLPPPQPSSCEVADTSATSLASSSDLDEADDERQPILSAPHPPIHYGGSSRSSRRSTPRSSRASDDVAPFDIAMHFKQYRLQCVDVSDDVHHIALAAARLNTLHAFAPLYFESAPEGLLMAELRAEYSAFLSHSMPPANAVRIGQLSEKIRQLI